MRFAGARDRVAAQLTRIDGKADAGERVDVNIAGEHEVLLARDPYLVAELGQRDHLVARDQAEVHGHSDPAVMDTEMVGRPRQRRQLEVVEAAPEAQLHPFAHAVRADVVDHELEARLHPRDAVPEVLAPLVEDRCQYLYRFGLGTEAPRSRAIRGTDESPPPTSTPKPSSPSRSAPTRPTQLISGAAHASAHAVIAILCLRGRSE